MVGEQRHVYGNTVMIPLVQNNGD